MRMVVLMMALMMLNVDDSDDDWPPAARGAARSIGDARQGKANADRIADIMRERKGRHTLVTSQNV